MDPLTISLLVSSALQGLGGLMGGPQERQSFDDVGNPGVRPGNMLGNGLSGLTSLSSALGDKARKGITLRSSYVQQPPTFTGGGLPFPIGVTGRDPALNDPSLLHLDGLNLGPGIFGGGAGFSPGQQTGPGGGEDPTHGGSTSPGEPNPFSLNGGITRRDTYSGTGASGDDIGQAIQALRILGGHR